VKRTRKTRRLEQIVDLLSDASEVTVSELADRFNVTPMTVRRDLEALEDEGRVVRTHGGAVPAAPSIAKFAFRERQQTHLPEKQAIARAAAERVEPGMTVLLDTGTTTLELARLLSGIGGLRVLTSSLAIASALFAHEELELILLGGTVNQASPDLSGPLTEANLESFRADVAFIGADAADADGLYTRSQEIARVSRAMIATAGRKILLADSSKFGSTAFVRFAGWESLDGVVVDEGLVPDREEWLREAVEDVTLVTCDQE
jgi:DeoR/GlpR family transcriptional regulator of sugar metabolism